MQSDYKTILATCIRLKDSTMNRQSLISCDNLYQVVLPLLKEVDCLIAALPIEFAVQKTFIESDHAGAALGGVVNNFGLGKLVSDLDNLNAIVNSGNQPPPYALCQRTKAHAKRFSSAILLRTYRSLMLSSRSLRVVRDCYRMISFVRPLTA